MKFRVIALMMEAERTSETSVNFNVTTRLYTPEDSKLHTRCREYLKSRTILINVSQMFKLFTRLSNATPPSCPAHDAACSGPIIPLQKMNSVLSLEDGLLR
jgi:hypothetical protein